MNVTGCQIKPMPFATALNTKPLCSNSRNKNIGDSVSFGNILIINELKKIETPIADNKEFRAIFEKMYRAKSNSGKSMWLSREDLDKYKNVSEIEKGLIPYCGYDDNSFFINMFLSGRLTPKMREKWNLWLPMLDSAFVDVIRVFEYALKALDNEFGKFKGIVYRQGFMSEKPNEYISTSHSAKKSAMLKNNYNQFNPNAGFSVIRVNNGHKINEFQKKADTIYAKDEDEILLPYKSKYKRISKSKMDRELQTAKEEFASTLFAGADKLINGAVKEYKGYTREKLLRLINVYEEV